MALVTFLSAETLRVVSRVIVGERVGEAESCGPKGLMSHRIRGNRLSSSVTAPHFLLQVEERHCGSSGLKVRWWLKGSFWLLIRCQLR